MRKALLRFSWPFIGAAASVLAITFIWIGCSESSEPLAPLGDQQSQSLAKRSVVPGIEVKPVYRVPTGRKGELLTVFVFYEKGGKGGGGGKKPPKEEPTCSDPNENSAFVELGVRWAKAGNPVKYQPLFEPDAVAGLASDAIGRAFRAWNTAAVSFKKTVAGPLPPERDNSNVVGWRQFVGGRDAKRILAAAFIWDDGKTIQEVDIVYNTGQKWAVNDPIGPGSELCGDQFDVQAIGAHEIGHMLGLGHVNPDDATMYGFAAKGELKKQTLTPGDVAGEDAVAP